MNNSNLVCGYFLTTDSMVHGFFYDGTTFTQYDAPGATGTWLTGLNDAGDFCGYADVGERAFVSIGGTVVDITIPGVTVVFPRAVNNLGQVAGTYQDPENRHVHGFFRDADGTLTYPLDIPHAAFTHINGLNDRGFMAGSWQGAGTTLTHGFVLNPSGRSVSFDYPDSEFGPTFFGINNSGGLPGTYVSGGRSHAFIAKFGR